MPLDQAGQEFKQAIVGGTLAFNYILKRYNIDLTQRDDDGLSFLQIALKQYSVSYRIVHDLLVNGAPVYDDWRDLISSINRKFAFVWPAEVEEKNALLLEMCKNIIRECQEKEEAVPKDFLVVVFSYVISSAISGFSAYSLELYSQIEAQADDPKAFRASLEAEDFYCLVLTKIQQEDVALNEKQALIQEYEATHNESILKQALLGNVSHSYLDARIDDESFQKKCRLWQIKAWHYLLKNHDALSVDLNRALPDFAKAGHIEHINELLAAGANLAAMNEKGETALSAAMEKLRGDISGKVSFSKASVYKGNYLGLCRSLIAKEDASLDSVCAPQTERMSDGSLVAKPSLLSKLCDAFLDKARAQKITNKPWEKNYKFFFKALIKKALTDGSDKLSSLDRTKLLDVCFCYKVLHDFIPRLFEAGAEFPRLFVPGRAAFSAARLKTPVKILLKTYSQAKRDTCLSSSDLSKLEDFVFVDDQEGDALLREALILACKDYTCKRGVTPLMKIVSKKDTTGKDYEAAIAKGTLFLGWSEEEKKNFQIHAKDDEGVTAFYYAVVNENEPACQWLIGKGVALDTRYVSGLTALHHAVLHEDEAVCRLLIEQGAPLDAKDDREDRRTPAECASSDFLLKLEEITIAIDESRVQNVKSRRHAEFLLSVPSLVQQREAEKQQREAEQITKAKQAYSQATRNWILSSGGIAVGLTTASALTFAFTPALSAAFSAAGGTISFVAMALLVTALAVAIPLLVRKCQRRKQSWSLASSDQANPRLSGERLGNE